MPGLRRHSTQGKRPQVADLLNPENGYRGKLERMGIEPKNHMKENVEQLRNTQKQNRERQHIEQQQQQQPEQLYKLPQFRSVEPRIYDVFQESPTVTPRRDFLVKHQAKKRLDDLALENRLARDRLEREMESMKLAVNDSTVTPRKAPIPRLNETTMTSFSNSNKQRTRTDFIAQNKTVVLTPNSPSNASRMAVTTEQGNAKHEFFGRIPDYLAERKTQKLMEEEERRKSLPDPSCPPGMVRLSEEQRLVMLETLTQNRKNFLHALQSLPFVVETPSQRRRKEDLENKLRETENSIAIFDRPVVYVRK